MTKYSFEQKVTVVQEYLSGSLSQRSLAEKHNINESMVAKWIKKVQTNGYEALKVSHQKRYFDGQAKLDILNYKTTNNLSRREVARHFSIEDSMLYQWEQKFKLGGIEALNIKQGRPPKMTKPKKVKPIPIDERDQYEQEILELKLELQRTRLELAVSKKLEALAQQKRPNEFSPKSSKR
jgi:transposase